MSRRLVIHVVIADRAVDASRSRPRSSRFTVSMTTDSARRPSQAHTGPYILNSFSEPNNPNQGANLNLSVKISLGAQYVFYLVYYGHFTEFNSFGTGNEDMLPSRSPRVYLNMWFRSPPRKRLTALVPRTWALAYSSPPLIRPSGDSVNTKRLGHTSTSSILLG